MNSYLIDDFIECFKKLPDRIKNLARKNYGLWKENPKHPSLNFKKIESKHIVYSIRVGLGWRALGTKESDDIIWFWIGSHSEIQMGFQRVANPLAGVIGDSVPYTVRIRGQRPHYIST